MARSKAQQVAAQPETVTLEGVDPKTGDQVEIEWEIHPLDMDKFLQVDSMPENATQERLKHILFETLKQDDENLEKEHLDDMDFKHVQQILEAIGEVNGIEDFFDEEEIKSAMENRA